MIGHIWEFSKNSYFELSKDISSYIEASGENEHIVFVNTSFAEDFCIPNLNSEEEKFELLKKYIEDERYKDFFNLIMHSLSNIDHSRALSFQDVYAIYLKKEILNGSFGNEIADYFLPIEEKHKWILCSFLAKYYMGQQKELHLEEVLRALFGKIEVFYEPSTKIYHIYIDKDKNLYNAKLCVIAKKLFQNINTKVHICWKGQMFGVIAYDDTMKIDNICLI